MIGQRVLLKKIDNQIGKDRFPRVSIIVGEKGSGRKTLIHHISAKLNHGLAFILPTSNAIEQILDTAYKVSAALPMVYAIVDCDNISDETATLIVSIIKDLPYESYFIITCENPNNIPQEIKAKAVTYWMESYSDSDMFDWLYENEINDLTDNQEEFITEVATNIGELKQLCEMNIDEFKAYIDSIMEYVTRDADNSLEITSKIAFNDEDGKYPLYLILKAFTNACADNVRSSDSVIYCVMIAETGDALQKLPKKGADYKKIYEEWIASIKSQWNNIKG